MRTRKATFALTASATALATAFGIGAAHASADVSGSYFPATATLSNGTVTVNIDDASPALTSTECSATLYPTSDTAAVTTFVTSYNASQYPDPSTVGTPLGTASGGVPTPGHDNLTLTITPTTAASAYSVLVVCMGAYSGASSTLAGSSGTGSSGSLDWTGSTGSTT